MKSLTASIITLVAATLLSGCFKDTRSHTYKIYTPVYKTTEEVRANVKSNTPRNIVTPGKLVVKGNYIFLNELDKGIHVIDNSNPSSPRNIAFINIPGNIDLAAKGDMLYADLYVDMVAIDISNPQRVVAKKFISNAFPERRYSNGFVPESNRIITEWLISDTTIVEDMNETSFFGSCRNCMLMDARTMSFMANPSASTNSVTGTGGSMARFSIVQSTLYTVGSTELSVYSINEPANPVFTNKTFLGIGIETIFPFQDKLFIGSSSGMFMYNIANPANPTRLGQFSHITACDPVVADERNAFVTLSSGTRCSNASNQLDVLDISNLNAPTLVRTYPMTNPKGLFKDDNNLFICDGKDGLKLFDASNVKELKLVNHIKGFESYDVIALNKLAIVVAKDGLRQYDYSNLNDIRLLSMLGWAQ